MASTRHGSSGLTLQPGSTVVQDAKGGVTGRATWKCPKADVATHLATTDAFPLAGYSYLALEKRTIKYEAAHAVIAGEYAGTTYTAAAGDNEVEELIIGTSEEPIETHPDFSTFAGTPSAPNATSKPIFVDPDTGAVTTDDAKGMFAGFASSGDLAGVVSYLASRNITFRKSWTQDSAPSSMGGVGQIDSGFGAPAVTGSYTWLYVGMSYRNAGAAYTVSKEWKLSGPGGWDTDIY